MKPLQLAIQLRAVSHKRSPTIDLCHTAADAIEEMLSALKPLADITIPLHDSEIQTLIRAPDILRARLLRGEL